MTIPLPLHSSVQSANSKHQRSDNPSATTMPPPASATDGLPAAHPTIISINTAGTLWKRANRYQHGICCCWRELGKAYQCYMAAANMYNQLNKYEEATECFFQAGQAAQASRRYYAASEAYVESITVHRQVDFAPRLDVLACLLSVCDEKVDGDTSHPRTGRIEKSLAEVLEENGRLKRAAGHFASAYELFREEDRIEESLQCEINLARLLGTVGEYAQAAQHYTNLGTFQFEGEHRRHHSREYLIRSLLCWAACLSREEGMPRLEMGRKRREMILTSDPTFAETTEFKMIMLLGDALHAGDVVLFDQFVSEMEANGLMDSWKSRLIPLVRRKQFGDPHLAPPVVVGEQPATADTPTGHEPVEADGDVTPAPT